MGRSATDPEAQVDIWLKSGKNLTFLADHAFRMYAANRTVVQRIPLPNYVRVYLPPPESLSSERLRSVMSWFLRAVNELNVCYAYLNPALMYDELNVGRENASALAALADNPVLDLFEDYNHHRFFLTHVKGPMWLNVLGPQHIAAHPYLSSPTANPFFSSTLQTGGRLLLQLTPRLGLEPTPERLRAYRALADWLRPLYLDSFNPVMFEFPYRWPVNQAQVWLRRFLVSRDGAA